jgi:hypothetical protein
MGRFSKVFQLITVVLLVGVVNVYVMGAPKVSKEPGKADTATNSEAKADTTGAEVAKTTVAPVAVAAEKLPLVRGSRVDFNRIFSKSEITSHASTSHSFLNAKTAGRDLFKAPARPGTVPQNDDSGGGGSRGTWIAVGIIAAVLTVAVIGLRHDRDSGQGSAAAF